MIIRIYTLVCAKFHGDTLKFNPKNQQANEIHCRSKEEMKFGIFYLPKLKIQTSNSSWDNRNTANSQPLSESVQIDLPPCLGDNP